MRIFANINQIKTLIMIASHVLTFLGGAFLGIIAALLLAPEKGEITRRKIKEKLE